MVSNMHYVPKNNYENIMYDRRKELLGYWKSIVHFLGLSYLYDEIMKVSIVNYIVNICILVYSYFIKPYFNYIVSVFFFVFFIILVTKKKILIVVFVSIVVILLYGFDKKTPIRLMS